MFFGGGFSTRRVEFRESFVQFLFSCSRSGGRIMFAWRIRFAVVGLIAFCSAMSTSCGYSSPAFIAPSAVVLLPGQSFQFTISTASLSVPPLLVNGVAGGSSSVGTITRDGLYTAPATPSGQQVTIGVKGQSSSAAVTIIPSVSGSVTATQQPLVAS